jgi:hypothetical protein
MVINIETMGWRGWFLLDINEYLSLLDIIRKNCPLGLPLEDLTG